MHPQDLRPSHMLWKLNNFSELRFLLKQFPVMIRTVVQTPLLMPSKRKVLPQFSPVSSTTSTSQERRLLSDWHHQQVSPRALSFFSTGHCWSHMLWLDTGPVHLCTHLQISTLCQGKSSLILEMKLKSTKSCCTAWSWLYLCWGLWVSLTQ